MILVQISDTHIIDPSNKPSKVAENRIDNLENCVSNILKLETKPNALIHTGDVSHNGSVEEYQLFLNIIKKLNIPIFYTPGNRDNRKNLTSIFTHSYLTDAEKGIFIYSSNFAKFRLVSFDTSCDRNNQGEITIEKLSIFSKILNKERNIPTVIFMHHPPFNISLSSSKIIEFNSQDLLPKFRKILSSNNNIVGLFCGHIHRNFKSKIGNVISYTLPPVALDLHRDKDKKKNFNKVQYLLHTYSEVSGISTKRILVN